MALILLRPPSPLQILILPSKFTCTANFTSIPGQPPHTPYKSPYFLPRTFQFMDGLHQKGRKLVQYKEQFLKLVITTCMGVDVVEIPSVSEVSSPSSQKPVKQWSSCKNHTHILQTLSEKHEKYRYIFQLQHIHKETGALSTNDSKKTQVKETTASNEGGTVGVASTQKDIVESTSIVGTMLTINLRKTTK